MSLYIFFLHSSFIKFEWFLCLMKKFNFCVVCYEFLVFKTFYRQLLNEMSKKEFGRKHSIPEN